MRRKMIGQRGRVFVVEREKCPEKKISLVNREVVIESSSVRTSKSSVRTSSVQFGPPRSQLLLRLLLKLVSESNCLENRSRILVILLFINLAADL